MPALDLALIDKLGRDLHATSPGFMSEDEVCPWTLFLTMALTLLKGVLPQVPKVVPYIVSDPEMVARVSETFTSDDFVNNIETYFVKNIKSDIQAPLNRQIVRSSESIMYMVDIVEKLMSNFLGGGGSSSSSSLNNDLGTTDDKPRGYSNPGGLLFQVLNFVKTFRDLTK